MNQRISSQVCRQCLRTGRQRMRLATQNPAIAGRPPIRSANSGFTLIEIMVVVAILAILGAAVVPKIMDRPEEARRVRAKTDLSSFAAALELYKLDNFSVPSTDQGLEALIEEPSGDPEPANWKQGGYVQKLTKDPWGRDYVYMSPGANGEYEIISYARDGREGGEGFDADISSAD